ncbi:MAG: alpha/beta hydrolase family protein [Victivallaceae bacterium]
MALIQCNFHSDALGMASEINVILPQPAKTAIGVDAVPDKKTFPVLYLLHGLSDDNTIWCRRTSIERYATAAGLVVVMPNGQRSFYADMAAGGKFWTYLSEELPDIVKAFFPVSHKREDTFAAGLSMGGYGALKLALRCPEKFAAAASLSGVADVFRFAKLYDTPQWRQEMINIFGNPENIPGSMNDLFFLSSQLAGKNIEKPKIFQCCGTEDSLYADNLKFREHMRRLDFEYHYQEAPGCHEWGFWDRYIQDVIKWLPMAKS